MVSLHKIDELENLEFKQKIEESEFEQFIKHLRNGKFNN